MKRHLGCVAAATTLLLSLYACSSDSANEGGQDGGLVPGQDGSSSGSSGSSGGDGSSNPDALTDGQTNADGAADAAIEAPVVDPGPPRVRFIGRFDMAPAAGPKVAYPGAQILARFSGTEVKATFSDELLFTDYGANRWEGLVDGMSKVTIQLDRTQPTTYTIATGLPLGPHTVQLFKLTEGNVGTTQFRGFDFSGGVLLPPPLPNARRMQFLADSASSGYGIEGADQNCGFSAATENERKSYPALIAHDLSADSHNLAAAGKGVYQNNYRPLVNPDTDVFSVIYQHVGVHAGTPLWSAASYSPDVVWITLGGNDYDVGSGAGAPGAPPAGQFQPKYDALVVTVRTQHPNAHIFCAVAPSLTNAYPAGYDAYTNVKTGVQAVVNAHAADNKIYFFEFTRSVDADLTACEGHTNVAKHRAMADEAIVIIKQKTGW